VWRALALGLNDGEEPKKLADASGYRVPTGSVLAQDTGFPGFRLAGVALLQPTKQPRGGELSYADKVRHRLMSRIRVRIEHAIGGVKRYRMVKDKLRNWKSGCRDLVFETCCGLHNFRLNFRPWHYKPVLYIDCLLKS
jgi:DDE superfamily endonuclease